jgi:hypothetical protein
LAATEDFLDDGGAVEGEAQGAADAWIGEWGTVNVEAKKISAQQRIDAEEFGRALAVAVDFARRDGFCKVELTGPEGTFLGVDGLDGVEVDGV